VETSDKIILTQRYGLGFLGSAVIQTLLVLWLPSLMTYIGTTIIVMLAICYLTGLILLLKHRQLKHEYENINSQQNKSNSPPWSDPKQKYLLTAVLIFIFASFLLVVIQNLYINEPEQSENESFEYLKSTIVGTMIALVVLYLVLHRKNNWGNKRGNQQKQFKKNQREQKGNEEHNESKQEKNNAQNQNYDWCYEILGILSDASKDEVKDRYRELAMQMHPDKNRSFLAEERFKKIKKAYDTLKKAGKTN